MRLLYYVLCVLLASFSKGEQDAVFRSIFDKEYVVSYMNVTNGPQVHLPDGMCRGQTWKYTHFIETGERTGTYRVPHSRIFVDGVRCGTLLENATESELWRDSYMLLVPYQNLTSDAAATAVYAGGLYYNLHDPGDRHGVCLIIFSDWIRNGFPLWVGYEEYSPLVCGDVQILPRTTFTLFSITDNRSLDITKTYDNQTEPVVIQKGEYFQIVFDEPFVKTPENPDRICPAVQTKIVNPLPSAPNEGSCFPSSALVKLIDEANIPMSELKLGSKVLDLKASFSEVILFTHRDQSARLHSFTRFETTSNLTLTVSPGHYVYTPDGLIPADSVDVGSILITADGSQTTVIQRYTVLLQGLYNPQTSSGSLIVDGFAVSAYTTAINPLVGHVLLFPIRLLYRNACTAAFAKIVLSKLFAHGAEGISWFLLLLPAGRSIV